MLVFWPLEVATYLTLILLTWTIWRAPSNASKWRVGFNSAFKGLNVCITTTRRVLTHSFKITGLSERGQHDVSFLATRQTSVSTALS